MSNKSNLVDSSYIPTPDTIEDEGLLVGWSLEHEKKKKKNKPIGFIHNDKSQKPLETLKPILHKGPGHLMTIASTGAGKGVGCIIPTLLRHKGPVVVIDPKGENYAVTARARAEMGQKIVLLDPFEIMGSSEDALNPLDILLRFEGGEIEQAKMLADMIAPQSNTKDPFWNDKAKEIITAFILHIAEKSPQALQNFGELRYLLNQSRAELNVTVKEMLKSEISEVSMVAKAMTMTDPKVLASIFSTAQSHISFMAGSLISSATHSTSFDLEDVILGKPLSIYIVIPPDKIDTSSQLIRLWIGTLLSLIMMRSSAPSERTLFILDEAAQLGHMSLLTKAITLLRGYGLQTWSFWQDLSQLSSIYPDWETLYNNCRIHQDFGITNAKFAKQVSDLTGYPFYREILKLDNDEMILQVAGDEAVIAQRPNYITDAIFKGLADPNPFHTKDDEDDLAPQQKQRRYTRRKNRNISGDSEVEELKSLLKDALKSVKEATEETRQAKEKVDKLTADNEAMKETLSTEDKLKRALKGMGNQRKKTKEEESTDDDKFSDGSPW